MKRLKARFLRWRDRRRVRSSFYSRGERLFFVFWMIYIPVWVGVLVWIALK